MTRITNFGRKRTYVDVSADTVREEITDAAVTESDPHGEDPNAVYSTAIKKRKRNIMPVSVSPTLKSESVANRKPTNGDQNDNVDDARGSPSSRQPVVENKPERQKGALQPLLWSHSLGTHPACQVHLIVPKRQSIGVKNA